MGRNTQILNEVVSVLSLTPEHLVHLEQHYRNALLVNAGDVDVVSAFATQLRLRVTSDEYHAVLDYIGNKGMVSITVDTVEQAVNELLGEDRFIEPGE